MEDIISGAKSFSQFLRFQMCKKNKQVLKREIYSYRIWGSQIKGGLEVCDAILLENQDIPFVSAEDVLTRYKNLALQLTTELPDIDTLCSHSEYAIAKSSKLFGILNKKKIEASVFQEDVRVAVLRGSLKTCKDLLKAHYDDPIMKPDIMMGDVHIIRMNLWNKYASSSKKMKKVDVLDTMLPNPSRSKLIIT